MAAGDLITRDGQYEFNGLLLNDSKGETDTLRVVSASGLFDLPEFKTKERELDDDHGGTAGRDLLAMRRIFLDIRVIASTKANMYSKLEAIAAAFQPQDLTSQFVFQRAGIGKRFVNAKPRRLGGFDTDAAMEHGESDGTVMLLAPDPRKLAFVQSSAPLVIAASGTTVSGVVTMAGNFKGGAKPILEIAGPVTNPRIGNTQDGNRQIRIDIVISAGQTLIVNANDRSVTMAGVDQSSAVRSDNQWWNLLAGANTISFTRSNSPATAATLTVKWWDSYV